MILDSVNEQLTSYLDRAKFSQADVEGPPINQPSLGWTSDYGILLCVDARGADTSQLCALTRRCDDYLAEQIERTANDGIELDAHLCLFVDSKYCNAAGAAANDLSEVEASRFVSRKYFLDSEKAAEEIIGRLTLLWPDIDASGASEPGVATPPQLSDLRTQIESKGGAASAKRFLEQI